MYEAQYWGNYTVIKKKKKSVGFEPQNDIYKEVRKTFRADVKLFESVFMTQRGFWWKTTELDSEENKTLFLWTYFRTKTKGL